MGTSVGLPYTVHELENTICTKRRRVVQSHNQASLQLIMNDEPGARWTWLACSNAVTVTYLLDLVLSHGLYEVDCASNIMSVVEHGELNTLSDSFASSKVDDGIISALG